MEIDVSKLGINKPDEPNNEDPLVIILRTFIGPSECRAKNSIIDTINTGSPVVFRELEKPKYASPLFKEYFLSEFQTVSEKKKARDNLGIYSSEEVDTLVNQLLGTNLANYFTKSDVEEMLNSLEYVIPIQVNKVLNFDIPKRLFL